MNYKYQSNSARIEDSARISTASFSAGEVINQFKLLLESLDLHASLEILGIAKFKFMQRKKAKMELTAISIAFWRLALASSFPTDAQDFLKAFTSSEAFQEISPDSKYFQSRVNIYIDIIKEKKESDFEPVATYLLEVLELKPEKLKALTLRLSLKLRELYGYIFKNLV